MWTTNALQKAAQKRNEHINLSPDVERIILALERAMGRTEEVLRRELAKEQLKSLLAVLDIKNVPDHVQNAHPELLKFYQQKTPTTPLPVPAAQFDGKALAALISEIDAGVRVAPPGTPEKHISLEPQQVRDKQRSNSGPSR